MIADDAYWEKMDRTGRLTGHLVARCPACGERQMIAYRSQSAAMPNCRVCRAEDRRLVCESDRSLVWHKNPGEPFKPTVRSRLLKLGLIRNGTVSEPKTEGPSE